MNKLDIFVEISILWVWHVWAIYLQTLQWFTTTNQAIFFLDTNGCLGQVRPTGPLQIGQLLTPVLFHPGQNQPVNHQPPISESEIVEKQNLRVKNKNEKKKGGVENTLKPWFFPKFFFMKKNPSKVQPSGGDKQRLCLNLGSCYLTFLRDY